MGSTPARRCPINSTAAIGCQADSRQQIFDSQKRINVGGSKAHCWIDILFRECLRRYANFRSFVAFVDAICFPVSLTTNSITSSDWVCSLVCALSSTTRVVSPIIISTISLLILLMFGYPHSNPSNRHSNGWIRDPYCPNRSEYIPNLEMAESARLPIRVDRRPLV